MRSHWVDEEWRTKYDQQLAERRVRVIPILLEECTLPPMLQGRLALAVAAQSELLQTGHLEIDWAIQEHQRRLGAPLSRLSNREESVDVSLRNARTELANALGSGPVVSERIEHVSAIVTAVRFSAINRYDAGYPRMAVAIYREIILAVGRARFANEDFPEFLRYRGMLDEQVRFVTDSGVLDPWEARMVMDSAVDYVRGLAAIRRFSVSFDRWYDERFSANRLHYWDYMDCWKMLDDWRSSVAPFKSFQQCCDICAMAMRMLERGLSRMFVLDNTLTPDEKSLHLSDAVMLRVLRWAQPGKIYRKSDKGPGREVGDPIDVIHDLHSLTMSGFQPNSFFFRMIEDDEMQFLRTEPPSPLTAASPARTCGTSRMADLDDLSAPQPVRR